MNHGVCAASLDRLLVATALVGALVGCGASPSVTPDAAAADAPAADDASSDASDASIDPRFAAYVTTVRSAIDRAHVPGASIAVVMDGHLAFAAGIGVKQVDVPDPVTTSTLFRVGSMTKMLTAAALMNLAEHGTIDPSHAVTEYVPYFAVRSPAVAGDVLVRHLLTHTAGLPDGSVVTCTRSLADWFHAQNHQPLWSPPGVVWNYSNQNFELAGLVAEAASGVPYDRLVHDRVFVPAGMTTATFDAQAAQAADHAVGHELSAAGVLVRTDDAADYDCPYAHPAGYAFATATDYARFAEALLGGGHGVVSQASIEAMEADQVATRETPAEHYGYALFTQPHRGVRLVHHDGAIPGWRSAFVMVPERRFAVVVLLNGDDLNPDALAIQAVDSLLGLTGADPSYATDPSTWGAYEGSYNDPNRLGTVVVTRTDSQLHVSIARLGGDAVVRQLAGDTFLLTVGGGQLPVTFWRDADAPARYLVTRAGVAARAR